MTRALSQADCDRMRRLCEIHPQHVVARLLKVNKNVVTRTKRRGFKEGHSGPDLRPMPDDFAIMRDKMPLHALAKHYRTGQACIYRWIAEVGGRDYTPRSSARKRPQRVRPEREVIEAAIAEHGVTSAAGVLGVHTNTLQKWREFYGLTIHRKRAIELRKRERIVGWADRYFEVKRSAAR